jgi:hypothetical protein
MRFLVTPRSQEAFPVLLKHMELCRCRDGPAIVRDAPWDLHSYFKGHDHEVVRFAAVLCREVAPNLENRKCI